MQISSGGSPLNFGREKMQVILTVQLFLCYIMSAISINYSFREINLYYQNNPLIYINLSFDGGGPYVPRQSVFIFLPKISPPDQTLRPTCKFLILGLLYHDFFFLLKI